MKYSICIPSRGHVIGLWATICAVEHALAGREREYLVYLNGKPDEPHSLLAANLRLFWCHDPVPPPIARNRLADLATGDWLVFFDDHCLPAPDWFDQLDEFSADIVHSSYSTHVGYHRYYHFIETEASRENPLKGDYSREPLSEYPYLSLSAPHGGFAVRRTAWEAIGGYGDFWRGFGGEETYFAYKARRTGFETWMHPGMHYYHFSCRSETRGYDKSFNEENFVEALRRLEAAGGLVRPGSLRP